MSGTIRMFSSMASEHKAKKLPYLSCLPQHTRDLIAELHQRELPPSIQSFNQNSPSIDNIKELRYDLLIEGIELFHRLAVTPMASRKERFGDPMGGLHYSTDFADLLGSNVQAKDVESICHPQWTCCVGMVGGHKLKALIYQGHSPSNALNQLLKGPTVIECGMFSQLAIWFGIRYVLGDTHFDRLFSSQPFYITQLVNYRYDASWHMHSPLVRSPLSPFLKQKMPWEKTFKLDADEYPVQLAYVPNHPSYSVNHPGGHKRGFNNLFMGARYFVFDTDLSINPLSLEMLTLYLHQCLNAQRDRHDINAIKLSNTCSEFSDVQVSHEEYQRWLKEKREILMTAFNFNKLKCWAFYQLDAQMKQAAEADNIESGLHTMMKTLLTPTGDEVEPRCFILVTDNLDGIKIKIRKQLSLSKENLKGKTLLFLETIVENMQDKLGSTRTQMRESIKSYLDRVNPDVIILDELNFSHRLHRLIYDVTLAFCETKSYRNSYKQVMIATNMAYLNRAIYCQEHDEVFLPTLPGYDADSSCNFANNLNIFYYREGKRISLDELTSMMNDDQENSTQHYRRRVASSSCS